MRNSVTSQESAPSPEPEGTPAAEQPIRLLRGAVDPDSATRQGIVRIRCGDCAFLKGASHPAKGTPCSKLGVLATDAAPACYSPDVKAFRELSPEALNVIMLLVSGFTPKMMRIFLGLLRSGASLEPKGLRLMQQVVFNVGSREVLSDYYTGYVLGATPDGQVTVVGHKYLNEGRATCTAVLAKESLISLRTFHGIKNRLIQAGSIEGLPPRKRAAIESADYKPPNIDTAPDVLEAYANSRRQQKADLEEATKKSRGQKTRTPRKSRGVINMSADHGDGL